MKVKDLDNILMASRIVIVWGKKEIHYVLWSIEETIYKLEFPLEEFNSVDLFENHGEMTVTGIAAINNVMYVAVE